ncbi:hypothetical protein GCM10023153_33400 [Ornithinibacter aureus]|uniref:PqqD family protein n=1 Tax=Ornithinibacter aureus TaxID=622664 RepID=A0ABP8KCJ0_9MICO|nr:hypothetical protein [Ornithinibacter aureus]KAF0832329.1 hypothetical protein C8E84_0066 [Ornithinibacter aureus]
MKVQRRDATDVLTRDGETAVLIEGTVLRLSELSAAVYSLTAHAVEVSRLAGELERRFGAPAGCSALEATEAAVAELVRRGVLDAVQ